MPIVAVDTCPPPSGKGSLHLLSMTSWDSQRDADLARRKHLSVAAAALNVLTGTTSAPAIDETVRAITPFGMFDVPCTPQRVAVLDGRQDLETATALGLPSPIAVGVPLEDIAGLAPDLIIGPASMMAADTEHLAAVAPLVPVDVVSGDWKASLSAAGRWTGRRDSATDALIAYQERVNEFRMRHWFTVQFVAPAVMIAGANGTWHACEVTCGCLAARTLRDLGGYLSTTENIPGSEAIVVIADDGGHVTDGSSPVCMHSTVRTHRNLVFVGSCPSAGSVYSAIDFIDMWDRVYSTL